MKSLLIICKTQYGYHTDYTKYCEYLKKEFDITYLCFDAGFEKLEMENVTVKYVPWKGPKILRGIRFLVACIFMIARKNGVVFIEYFEKCDILKKIFLKRKMILNIRTLSVSSNKTIRVSQDRSLQKACDIYDHITPVSSGVQHKLNLHKEKATIIPLGSDRISTKAKSFEKLNLLYVGSLNGRNIDQTISGLSLFIKKHPDIPIHYDIIGDGNVSSELTLLIQNLKLTPVVKMHGRIPHFKLKPYFDQSNVGISYIPMTEYYEHQPPTKTYEYIMSGMPCIGTNTAENKKIITLTNGVLCDDNPESFSIALEKVYNYKNKYKSEKISSSIDDYTWENIVSKVLKPVLIKYS